MQERQEHGAFGSFFDLCERLDTRQVNKKVLESLMKGGALDSLGLSRAQMFGNMGRVLEWAQRQQEDRQQGQFSLFGTSTAGPSVATPSLEPVVPWSESEQLAYEKEALGFYISSHPLMAVQPQLRRLVTTTSQTLVDFQGEQTVMIGGLITQQRVQLTKNGDRMAFVTLEDLYGSLEVIVFPETYRQSITACESEEPVVVWGKAKIEGEGGEQRVIAQRVLLLKDALALGEFRV